MTRQKENAISDFMDMISHSWTWNRLTEDEKKRFINILNSIAFRGELKGTYRQRWDIMNNFYTFFLEGCGYKPFRWRETDEDAPQF